MRLLNFNCKENNIHHFQGGNQIKELMMMEYNTIKDNPIYLPENLTIVTVFTDKSLAILAEQLDNNNIPYINAAESFDGNFKMTSKIDLIYNALDKVTTDYVLVLDAYDVIIYTFDNILNEFLGLRCDILFNATKNNWPSECIDKIGGRDMLGEFCHLNAGCVIGYTDKIKEFYGEASKQNIELQDRNFNNSEQFVIRHVFSKYCNDIFMDYCKVKFDWNCRVFSAFGNTNCFQTNYEDFYVAI